MNRKTIKIRRIEMKNVIYGRRKEIFWTNKKEKKL